MAIDRNQQARDQFRSRQQQAEAQKLMQQFAQAAASGQVAVVDRFGNKIDVGSFILFHPPYDYVYTVVDVAPVLAPNMPPGYMRLSLELQITATVQVNQPQMTMIVVGKRDEAQAQQVGDEPPPPAPAPIQPPPVDDEPKEPIDVPTIIDPRD